MLTLYVDESFDERTGMYFVAGFAGRKSQWHEFAIQWKAALANRASLHLKELRLGTPKAVNRHGELLARLGRIPAKCGLIPVAGSVCTADYRQRVKDTALDLLMEGYVLSVIALLDGLRSWLPEGERVKVYFEENCKHEEQTRRALRFWKQRHRLPSGWSVVAGWGVLSKQIHLEAADYLCYALQQWNTDSTSQKARLTAPILSGGCIGNHLSKTTIEGWLETVKRNRVRPIPRLTREVKKLIREPQ